MAYAMFFSTDQFDYQVFRLKDSSTIRVYYRFPDKKWEFGHSVHKVDGMDDETAFDLVRDYLEGNLSFEEYNSRFYRV